MDYFEFKQFRIYHDKCAMKVGTDGVLLGAWAKVDQARRILDIGCGSGLIAIMAAQRCGCETEIVGLEIDAAAAAQAAENAVASPFGNHIKIIQGDVKTFQPDAPFDCIITNPPFFVETTLSPNAQRAMARHTDTLSYEALVVNAKRLMRPDADFQLIVPYANAKTIKSLCALHGLSLARQTDVATKIGATPKRSLLHFVNNIAATKPAQDILTIRDGDGQLTAAYKALTADFYLEKP